MASRIDFHDTIIIGAGVSGSWIADQLTQKGMRVLMVEAGRHFDRKTYPRREVDANSLLYWSGGIELNHDASIGLLRPKVVGGGSVVNQALLDRFDEDAFVSWKKQSGIEFFDQDQMAEWYERAEASIHQQYIPKENWNGNAEVFAEGFEKNGFKCAPLRRAQKDCRYAEGSDCIECLMGCRIDSKQSTPVTTLKRALESGHLELRAKTQAMKLIEDANGITIELRSSTGESSLVRASRLVLASGAIGNSKLLLASGYGEKLPALGHGFYTHPQYMTLALYDRSIRAHKGPFQALKSDDPEFRRQGFKLENVFAPPSGLAMLVPGFGAKHMETMKQMSHMACVEVAIRDTEPGRIELASGGRAKVTKALNAEDRSRRDRGLAAVDKIFNSTGAKKLIPGDVAIGLHLMGGCAIGKDKKTSVVSPEFNLHGSKRIFAADSSVFPNAPGINPSLTIMALSLRAAEVIAS
ncbi:MAG: GMC family oxidoreductase [Bdellovibrionota bacterium]